jgi:hypothetical protein
MELDEKDKSTSNLNPILTEINKLSDIEIQTLRNGVVDNQVADKTLNYVNQQITLTECEREMVKQFNYKI